MTLLTTLLRHTPSQAIRITAGVVKCELILVTFKVQGPRFLRKTLIAISPLTSSIYTPPGRLVTQLKFPDSGPIKKGGNLYTTFWQLAGNALRSKHVRHAHCRRSESYRYSNVQTTASYLKYRRSAIGKYLVVGAERPGESILEYGRRGSGGLK